MKRLILLTVFIMTPFTADAQSMFHSVSKYPSAIVSRATMETDRRKSEEKTLAVGILNVLDIGYSSKDEYDINYHDFDTSYKTPFIRAFVLKPHSWIPFGIYLEWQWQTIKERLNEDAEFYDPWLIHKVDGTGDIGIVGLYSRIKIKNSDIFLVSEYRDLHLDVTSDISYNNIDFGQSGHFIVDDHNYSLGLIYLLNVTDFFAIHLDARSFLSDDKPTYRYQLSLNLSTDFRNRE